MSEWSRSSSSVYSPAAPTDEGELMRARLARKLLHIRVVEVGCLAAVVAGGVGQAAASASAPQSNRQASAQQLPEGGLRLARVRRPQRGAAQVATLRLHSQQGRLGQQLRTLALQHLRQHGQRLGAAPHHRLQRHLQSGLLPIQRGALQREQRLEQAGLHAREAQRALPVQPRLHAGGRLVPAAREQRAQRPPRRQPPLQLPHQPRQPQRRVRLLLVQRQRVVQHPQCVRPLLHAAAAPHRRHPVCAYALPAHLGQHPRHLGLQRQQLRL
mmetsp:Transcript_13156/g.33800  ORF Transcript_13156/g.33800 Transcript_13156/m.33800 type:complete len:270 (-) Transcript_13156:101-910(-)